LLTLGSIISIEEAPYVIIHFLCATLGQTFHICQLNTDCDE